MDKRPTAADRLIASRLGAAAVEALAAASSGQLVGVDGTGTQMTCLAEVTGKRRVLTDEQVALLDPMTTAAGNRYPRGPDPRSVS